MTLKHQLFIVCTTLITIYFAHELNPSSVVCSDYEMLIVNTHHCVSRCPITCKNNICTEDGDCPCEGYYESSKQGLTCALECLPGCKAAGGYCATSNLCLCRKGFYFDSVSRQCWKKTLFKDLCLGRCLYGTCTSNGECICAQGFKQQTGNGTFPKRFFGQKCVPECRQNCGLNGYCFLPNMCTCRKKHHHYELDGRCHEEVQYLG